MTGSEIVKTADILSKFKEVLSKGLKIGFNEVSQFFHDGVADYLDRQYLKIAYTKTFLHRNEPVEFYHIFIQSPFVRILIASKQIT
jgi:hypothetical protein